MTMSDPTFSAAVESIQREYTALGHSLGWRFLCVSKQVLLRDPKIVFLTLNPGGRSIPVDHPSGSCESGCSYVVEQWLTSLPGQHKLQRQVQRLFAEIERQAGPTAQASVSLDASLIGYFVPFRSPRFADLHRTKESLAFAKDLWASLLAPLRPSLLLAIDPRTFRSMKTLCRAQGGTLVSAETLPTGWGPYTAEVHEYQFSDRSTMVVRLPHLSTFQLFSRSECKEPVEAILARGCRHL